MWCELGLGLKSSQDLCFFFLYLVLGIQLGFLRCISCSFSPPPPHLCPILDESVCLVLTPYPPPAGCPDCSHLSALPLVWVARPWQIPSQLSFASVAVGSGCVFLPGLWCRPAASHRDTVITQSNTNTTVLTDHSAGFITVSFTHQMHKSLPDRPPDISSPPPHLALSHMLHILFLISLPVFPIPSVSLPPLRHGTGDDPSCFAQVCLYEANVLKCTGMKERKEASKHSITDQVSLHLCRSQWTLCLRPLFFPSSHLLYCFSCDIHLHNNACCLALPADKEQLQWKTGRHGGKK